MCREWRSAEELILYTIGHEVDRLFFQVAARYNGGRNCRTTLSRKQMSSLLTNTTFANWKAKKSVK